MAFDRSNMARSSSHGNSNAPVTWAYSTTDLATDVDTSGYFNEMINELEVGDLIYAHVDTDGTPAYILYPVISNDGTNVDVSNGTALSATNTD